MTTGKRIAKALVPHMALEAYRGRKLGADVRRLMAEDVSGDESQWWEALQRHPAFRPQQVATEILDLLAIVRAAAPQIIVEIGGAAGGTLFLFALAAAPTARLFSLDIGYDRSRSLALPGFRRAEQRITCRAVDSHAPSTLAWLLDQLGGEQIDFLFIDGDHSYDGVRQDYELFAPLVRSGGLVAIHDIVPDYGARYGQQTTCFTGGVPQFWEELVSGPGTTTELIDAPSQNGYGIGVVEWKGTADSCEFP